MLEAGAVIAMVLIAIFPVIGIAGLVSMSRLRKKCTQRVDARIVRLEERVDSRGVVSFYPVFSYSYGGVDYEKRSGLSSSSLPCSPGDYAELLIDPEEPENFICPAETGSERTLYMVCIIAGTAFIIMIGAAAFGMHMLM